MDDSEDALRDEIDRLDRAIHASEERVAYDRARQRELRGRRRDLTSRLRLLNGGRRTGADDLVLVNSAELKRLISEWLLDYDGDAPLRTLAERSNVSVRTISNVIHDRRNWVTLSTADMILSAMGCAWLLAEMEQKPSEFAARRLPQPPPSLYYEE